MRKCLLVNISFDDFIIDYKKGVDDESYFENSGCNSDNGAVTYL